MMNNYYFVAASLPEIILGENPDLPFQEFQERLTTNLSEEDLKKVEIIRRFIDLQNIRSLLSDEPLDQRGNLNEKELDEALLIEEFIPEYVFEFLNLYSNKEEKLKNFFGVFSRYYAEEIASQTGFLQRFLEFERQWRLVLLAIRAKKLHRDLIEELQFEDFSDPLVAHILAQRDQEHYDPPDEYKPLQELLLSCGEDPLQQYRSLIQYRFQKIDELAGYPLFSIDWILGYMVKLILAEQWMEMDFEKGKEVLETVQAS